MSDAPDPEPKSAGASLAREAVDWARTNGPATLVGLARMPVVVVLVLVAGFFWLARPGVVQSVIESGTYVSGLVTGRWPAEARIYVEPPQVYTRERLVNDRFREMNWLEDRLEALNRALPTRPNTTRSQEDRLGLSYGAPGGDEDPQAAAPANGAPASAPALDDTDAFNVELAHRLAVRSEMMNTLLDDSHDLRGATLYRLNFDVSIIPRPRARGFGLIAIDVHPAGGCSAETGPGGAASGTQSAAEACDPNGPAPVGQAVREYRKLLSAWELELQDFLAKVFESRLLGANGLARDPFAGSPKERMAFDWYVRARTVELWLGLLAGANGSECRSGSTGWECDDAARRDHLRALLDLPGSRETLPGDLSAGARTQFAEVIEAYGRATWLEIARREVREFGSALETALQPPPGAPPKAPSAPAGGPQPGAPLLTAGPPPAGNRSGPGVPPRAASGCPGAPGDWPWLACRMQRAGLDVLESDRACFGFAGTTDACPTNDVEALYDRIQNSTGCRAGRRPRGTSVPCPRARDSSLSNMLGLIRLASVLRTYHAVLSGQGGLLEASGEYWAQSKIAERTEALRACILVGENLSVAGQACFESLARHVGRPVERIQRAVRPALAVFAASEQRLFQWWLAEFFVDRLKRSDIPGYRPSPAIDRFFAVEAVKCEVGACEVMVSRKRWLGADDLREVDALRGLWDAQRQAQSDEAARTVIASYLRSLLPTTWRQCLIDEYRETCEALLVATRQAAVPADRVTLMGPDGDSQARRFQRNLRALLVSQRLAFSEKERLIVQDYIDSVTALVLKQRLEALGDDIVVYTVEPRLRSLVDDVSARRALSFQVAQDIPDPSDGSERLSLEEETVSILKQLSTRPTVVGFGHLRGRAGNERRATFGWIFLPNHLEADAAGTGSTETHRAVSHRVSAVISVPSWWTQVGLTVRQCWGRRSRVSDELITDPYAARVQCDGARHRSGLSPAGIVDYAIDLPATPQRITEVFDFEVIKVPYIDVDPSRLMPSVEAGRSGEIIIEGGRLWRGTMVTLGQQRADTIQVLPDMKGVVATFNCVHPPPGYRHYTDLAATSAGGGRSDPANRPLSANVTVWTAQGKAITQAQIHPFRQRLEAERPCWLDEPERAVQGFAVPAGDPEPEPAETARPAD